MVENDKTKQILYTVKLQRALRKKEIEKTGRERQKSKERR